ncbi:MAG: hypothetical protein QXL57_01725 [Candidatus Bathyarchaeia archaeon]
MLKTHVSGMISKGNINMLKGVIIATRIKTPITKVNASLNFLLIFKPIAIPRMVASSARAFIKELIKFPLRAIIATKAIKDVKTPGIKPKSNMDKATGIPVKSNFNVVSNGKGIFKFEYFTA